MKTPNMIKPKIDLNNGKDNTVIKMVKKKIKVRKALHPLLKERGVCRSVKSKNTHKYLVDLLDSLNQKWEYLRMKPKDPKKPRSQVFPNGKPMNGHTPHKMKKAKWVGCWVRPADLEDEKGLPMEILKERQSEANKAVADLLAHGANDDICYFDIDTPNHDEFIKLILKNYPHWKSQSGADGKFHIPVRVKNLPDSFIGYKGTEGTLKKCFYNDLVAAAFHPDEHEKCEFYGGGWLYARKDTEVINSQKGMLIIDWEIFKSFVVVCEKEEKSVNNNHSSSKNVKHKFKAELARPEIIKKFQEIGTLIPSATWARSKGSFNQGGNWKTLLKIAKAIGIPYKIFDEMSKKYENYDKDKNKIKWDETKSKDYQDYTIDSLIIIARGLPDPITYELSGNWREVDRLVGEMTEKYSFQKERFAEIIQAELGTNDVLNDIKVELEELKEEKKECNSAKERKKIRVKIKELEANIKQSSKDGDKKYWDIYNKCKLYWERYIFKINYPEPGYAIADKSNMYYLKTPDMKLRFENVEIPVGESESTGDIQFQEFFQKWRKDNTMRTNNRCDFCPYPKLQDPNTFNLFRGLKGARYDNEGVSFDKMEDTFLRHIKILAGDQETLNPEQSLTPYEYLVRYLAHAVQFPGELPMVAILEKGVQGTGKSLFYSQFGRKIIGKEYTLSTAHLKDIVGKHSQIQQKLFVVMDEIAGKAGFAEKEKLKNIISDDVVSWEQKYKDTIQINNCARFIFTANGPTPVSIELGDRRFVVFQCSSWAKNLPEKQRTEYFNKLYSAFEDPRYVKTFYEYLRDFDLTLPERLQKNGSKIQFKPKNNRPFTKSYCDIQSVHIPTPYYYFKSLVPFGGICFAAETPEEKAELQRKRLDPKVLCNHKQTITREEMWADYQDYLTKIGKDREKEFSDATKFFRRIGQWCDNDGWDTALERFKSPSNDLSFHIYPIQMRELLDQYSHLLHL